MIDIVAFLERKFFLSLFFLKNCFFAYLNEFKGKTKKDWIKIKEYLNKIKLAARFLWEENEKVKGSNDDNDNDADDHDDDDDKSKGIKMKKDFFIFLLNSEVAGFCKLIRALNIW